MFGAILIGSSLIGVMYAFGWACERLGIPVAGDSLGVFLQR